MYLMRADDANRLLSLRNGMAGRTQYEGREERTDEFLLRLLDEISAAHDRRVTDLLAANTAEVERRRAAEAECVRLNALVADIGRERLALIDKLRAADFAADVYCGERDAAREKLSAERREREAAEALAARMWPVIQELEKAFGLFKRDPLTGDGTQFLTWFSYRSGRAAAALVREREERGE